MLALSGGLSAQNSNNTQGQNQIVSTLDKMVKDYHFNYTACDPTLYNKYNFKPNEVPTYSNEVYIQRIKEIKSAIPLQYNQYVKKYIDLYTLKKRSSVNRMLGLAKIYFPIFEAELDKRNLPLEFKYLAIVESALNTHAVSWAGATGMWQFMYNTGKLYDLKINSFVDERRDPFKSTIAACEYFEKMYDKYQDWQLVLASYNCGPGNVNKALKMSKTGSTFWDIMPYLPKETRDYVPAFIAATYVFNYPAEHNFCPMYVDFNFQQDTIQIVNQSVSLAQIAKVTGTDFFLLKDLNPELKRQFIPYSKEPYVLRVPTKVAHFVIDNRKALYTPISDSEMSAFINELPYGKISVLSQKPYLDKQFAKWKNVKVSNKNYASGGNGKVYQGKGNFIYYQVRSGDIVGGIAQKFAVSSNQIASWNGLVNYKIMPGQKLKIYTTKKYNTSTVSNAKTQKTSSSTKSSNYKNNKGKTVSYKIKSGDTLWDISKKFDVTIQSICSANGITTKTKLDVGQVLKIKL